MAFAGRVVARRVLYERRMNNKTLLSMLALLALPASSAEPKPSTPRPAPMEKPMAKPEPETQPKQTTPAPAEPKDKINPAERSELRADAGTPMKK